MEFNPDRFLKGGHLDSSVPDPTASVAFGYGRRVCPGRALSGETLFLMTASLLATLPDLGANPGILPPRMYRGVTRELMGMFPRRRTRNDWSGYVPGKEQFVPCNTLLIFP